MSHLLESWLNEDYRDFRNQMYRSPAGSKPGFWEANFDREPGAVAEFERHRDEER